MYIQYPQSQNKSRNFRFLKVTEKYISIIISSQVLKVLVRIYDSIKTGNIFMFILYDTFIENYIEKYQYLEYYTLFQKFRILNLKSNYLSGDKKYNFIINYQVKGKVLY